MDLGGDRRGVSRSGEMAVLLPGLQRVLVAGRQVPGLAGRRSRPVDGNAVVRPTTPMNFPGDGETA